DVAAVGAVTRIGGSVSFAAGVLRIAIIPAANPRLSEIIHARPDERADDVREISDHGPIVERGVRVRLATHNDSGRHAFVVLSVFAQVVVVAADIERREKSVRVAPRGDKIQRGCDGARTIARAHSPPASSPPARPTALHARGPHFQCSTSPRTGDCGRAGPWPRGRGATN